MDELQFWLGELTSGEDERAEAALAGLTSLGNQCAQRSASALSALGELAGSADEDTRWWALRALAEFDSPFVQKHLIAALEDEEPAVRECAALGLRIHPTPEAVPALVAALNDTDMLTADLAADALIDIGAAAVPVLLEVLEHGQPMPQLSAVRALALIGDPRAIPALYKALDTDLMIMEFWASQGLERMGVGMQLFKP